MSYAISLCQLWYYTTSTYPATSKYLGHDPGYAAVVLIRYRLIVLAGPVDRSLCRKSWHVHVISLHP